MNLTTPTVPRAWANGAEHREKLAAAINNMLRGKLNNTGTVTLTANAATTVLADVRIGTESVIALHATTANAAAALATTYFGTTGNGTVTISHANNAQADKTFKYAVLG